MDRPPPKFTKAQVAEFFEKVGRMVDRPEESPRPIGGKTRVSSRFTAVLEYIISYLHISQGELARRADITQSQVWAYKEGREGRNVSEDDISRICWAIAGFIDDHTEGKGFAKGRLDILLSLLFRSAGYSIQSGWGNSVWRQKFVGAAQAEPIRVGFFAWSELAQRISESEFAGVAADITQTVLGLLGHEKFTKVEVDFQVAGSAIRERQVDLFAPLLLRFPRRRAWLQFSLPIPEIKMPFDGIFEADRFPEILTPLGSRLGPEGLGPETLDPKRVVIITVKNEVAEAVAGVLFSRPPYQVMPQNQEIGHAEEALETAFESIPRVGGRVPIFFTNSLSCLHFRRNNPGRFKLLSEIFTWPALDMFELQLAFGIHPEERLLKQALDESIRSLTDMQYFKTLTEQYRGHNSLLGAISQRRQRR
ncbi:MAG: helix-turn-helix transcriptional regulator [Bryobacteraceae bacterium]